MAEGVVAALYRYPVKSLQGEAVEHVTFRGGYVVGDRRLAIVDPAAGKVLSAKRWAPLLEASALLLDDGAEPPVVEIALPDRDPVRSDDPAVHDVLSAWLDHEVRLASPPEGQVLPMEMGTDPVDDASETFDWPGPPGSWVDLAQAHWLTTASLAAARRLRPESDWDVRRFRPTGLIEVAGDGFVEDGWSAVELGEVRSEVFMPTVRCAMPARAQPGLPVDKGVNRALADHHDSNLGVYATVPVDGTIRVGDPVRPTTA